MNEIGLTGGIGSGKTYVSEVFKALGIPIYNSDINARILMNTDVDLIQQVKHLLGVNAYGIDQLINRKYISKVVFKDKSKLSALNAIVHPLVLSHFKTWAECQKSPFVIFEAAILYEAGYERHLDAVITVYAPIELRIKRVVLRDNISEELVKERINNQISDEIKVKKADYVIKNEGHALLLPQIMDIYNKLLDFSK